MSEIIICIIVSAVFVILGCVFARGKGAFLLSGYNMMSAEEKKKYNEKELLKKTSYLMFIIALGIVINGIGHYLKMNNVVTIINIILVIIIIAFAVYCNMSKKIKNK